ELLGVDRSEVHYGGLMMIYKPAGDGRDVPWHQDEVYWEFPAQRCHSLSVWMPLDEVTPESGCMQFLPGSHRLDVLRYREPPGEPLVLDQPVDVSRAVACPLAPGGATFHHCRTLHYTAPNTSARPRRAFTTIFHGPRTERTPPLVRPWRGEHG
ncbi:MAG TPA: phytanoyl-CoA dioxygenase family protein, partial [Myxococcota bacterium]|nr:phytanoyl-CoA dioxygenase family protein [Myxococcota bacterium]